jgi:hypothetical protein
LVGIVSSVDDAPACRGATAADRLAAPHGALAIVRSCPRLAAAKTASKHACLGRQKASQWISV